MANQAFDRNKFSSVRFDRANLGDTGPVQVTIRAPLDGQVIIPTGTICAAQLRGCRSLSSLILDGLQDQFEEREIVFRRLDRWTGAVVIQNPYVMRPYGDFHREWSHAYEAGSIANDMDSPALVDTDLVVELNGKIADREVQSLFVNYKIVKAMREPQ